MVSRNSTSRREGKRRVQEALGRQTVGERWEDALCFVEVSAEIETTEDDVG